MATNILRLPDVMARTGLSRRSIYAYISNGSFPKPIELGPRGWPGMYLIPIYLPFFMGGSFVVAMLFQLAGIGLIDNWFGLRRTGADVM